MENMLISELKNNYSQNRAKMCKAQERYICAKASNKWVMDIDQKSKIAVLSKHVFLSEDTGERITTPSGDFTMNDSDFKKYCELVHNERTRRGLVVPDYDTTSDYMTNKELHQAEDDLIEIGITTAPKTLRSSLQKGRYFYNIRREMIDLFSKKVTL